jgi:2-C-methyl-D-erythritol 4-phosphate cytidylyltransferase/2-C-methyl-D-erythritol 2,4-cyclodiphosphate synthase
MNVAVILAAGSSNRYKDSIPKQFQIFDNKMILEYSVDTFLNHPGIDEVLLIVTEEYLDFIKKKIKNCKIVVGGKTRQESSFIALNNCPKETKNILIHDAARPFIDNKIISKCLKELKCNAAVCPALPSIDTIAKVTGDNIKQILNRNELYRLQTPQAFDYSILFECYKKLNKAVTDDVSVIQEQGYTPKIILGSEKNMKITYKIDFEIIKALL